MNYLPRFDMVIQISASEFQNDIYSLSEKKIILLQYSFD